MSRSHPRPLTPILPPQPIASDITCRFTLLPNANATANPGEGMAGISVPKTPVPTPDALEFRRDGVKVVSPSPRESRLSPSSLAWSSEFKLPPQLFMRFPHGKIVLWGAKIEQSEPVFPALHLHPAWTRSSLPVPQAERASESPYSLHYGSSQKARPPEMSFRGTIDGHDRPSAHIASASSK